MGHGGKAEARGARGLLVRVIEDYPDTGDVVMAHEHLAELDVRAGQRATAKEHYRNALRLAPERHVYGDAALRLPELLIEDGNDADAARSAEDALREAARDAPDLARHPDVGFVDAERETLKEMQRLARN
jgi:predicted Zn-dependent protease